MTRVLSSFCLLCLTAATAAADDVRSVPLTLHPAAAPSPALKYPLLPELRDAIPGNAADHYRQAVKIMKRDVPPQSGWRPKLDKWLTVPLNEFPRNEASAFLKQCEAMFQEVKDGSRSESCDWGLTEQLRKTGIATRLDEAQEMRSLGVLLQLRIRFDLAEGRPLKSVDSLRIGFTLARHTAEQPTLICAFVGIAITSMMENRLEELIQQPDAPNLYWSLTDLPRPFVDLRKPLQGERVMAYGSFTGMAEMVADLNAKPLTQEQLAKTLNWSGFLAEEKLSTPDAADVVAIALHVLGRHETAKKLLIAQGRPKELVDAMSPLQVAMLDSFLQYEQMVDDTMKWQSLPYWEALSRMEKADRRHAVMLIDKIGPILPIARLLLPAVCKGVSARTRIDRRFAALRCVEAVRLYAAGHDSKLPPSLEEIKDAPIPIDPATGKTFDYRVVGDHAFLTCTPFPDQPPSNANTPSYELIIKHKGDQ